MTRECPYCDFAIRPDLGVCAACGRESEPWILFENTWWRQDEDGSWLRYEPFRPPVGWHRQDSDRIPHAVSVRAAAAVGERAAR